MADKAEFLQAINEAILDADSLERFINGNDTQDVLTRLSKRYPTLQKALKELFENGGIAGRFKTLTALQASSLVDGSYALVADDAEDKNGIYIKEGGEWAKSKYDLIKMLGEMREQLDSNSILTSVATAKTGAITSTVKEASPAAVFGENLLAYFDYDSTYTKADGIRSNADIRYIIGSGKYPLIKTENAQLRSLRDVSNPDRRLYYISSESDQYNVLKWDNGILGGIKKSSTTLFYFLGIPIIRTDKDSIFFRTNNLRFRGYRLPTGNNPAVFALESLSSATGEWESKVTWGVDYSSKIVTPPRESMLGNVGLTIALLIDNVSGAVDLQLNGEILNGSGRLSKQPFDSSEFLESSYVANVDTISGQSGTYSSAFLINTGVDVAPFFESYLERQRYLIPSVMRKDNGYDSRQAQDRYIRNINPRPLVLGGTYNIEYAEHIKQDFEKGEVIQGNLSELSVPISPNVAPWDEPHDRTLIDGSVTRLNMLPYPDDELNENRVLLLANALYYPPNTSKGISYMCAYESTDGGANFERMELENPQGAPHATSTTTINNIVVSGKMGRYMYLGDHFPNGYQPAGMDKAYKYFFITETDHALYACEDVLNFTTYIRVPINKQAYPVYDSVGNINHSRISGNPMYETATMDLPGNENKFIGYDLVSNRFFHVLKAIDTTMNYLQSGDSESQDYKARNLVISWSDVGDITRWGPYEELFNANRGFYQNYDLDVIQVTDSCWALLVFKYTDYGPETDNTTPYADQNLRMQVDLYISRDQLRTPPVLMREGWLDNTEQQWASGTLWAYGHPFDKSKIYINGAEGLHGGFRPDADYYDYAWKVALVDYPFPVKPTPDLTKVTGLIRSYPMDGGEIDKLRLIAKNGSIALRVLNSQGNTVSGMDFSDFHYDKSNELASWNGLCKLPSHTVQIEALAIECDFGGVYPMKELFRKF